MLTETIATDPRAMLVEHHRVTEEACTALLARTYADDPLELVTHFRVFERALLEHIAAEEELILPEYASHAPEDAQAIRADHAAIRDALNRVGIEVELHVIRAHTVERLVASLRAHAAREDGGMYPWARENLSPSTHEELIQRVARSLRELLEIRRRPAPGSQPYAG